MGQTTIGTGFSSDTSNLKIIIKDDVKVGTGAKIIAGKGTLLIEGGVVVGANAVVTKNLTTKNGVYVGIPAKLIKN
jgi:acetyltransferase-like isoleucine patch superfamily enzyme